MSGSCYCIQMHGAVRLLGSAAYSFSIILFKKSNKNFLFVKYRLNLVSVLSHSLHSTHCLFWRSFKVSFCSKPRVWAHAYNVTVPSFVVTNHGHYVWFKLSSARKKKFCYELRQTFVFVGNETKTSNKKNSLVKFCKICGFLHAIRNSCIRNNFNWIW